MAKFTDTLTCPVCRATVELKAHSLQISRPNKPSLNKLRIEFYNAHFERCQK